jgi:hypothetical protein
VGTYTLSLYQEDARSLLRDGLGIFTPTKQLNRWINQGRRQAARRTGCVRLLVNGQSQYGASAQPGFMVPGGAIPGNLPDAAPGSGSTNLFQTIPNQEAYPFSFIANFMRAQYAGSDEVTDIVDCAVAWGSATYRPVLNWCPFEEMQAYMRAYNVVNSAFPLWWSTQGDGTNQVMYLWPPPVEAMEIETDVIALPKPLNTDNDYEILSDNFATAVKYWAAGMCYLNSRPENARIHFDYFADSLGVGRFASDYGKSPSMYC